MRLYFTLLFLTLVVSGLAANAAPSIDRQLTPISISPKNQTEAIYSSERTERNWSVRFGLFGGALSEAQQGEQFSVFGIRYDFMKETLETWQIEVSTGKNNFMHLVLGKKFHFALETVTMPYYKFAVGNIIGSTEGIGSIFNIKKIQGIAAVGLDDLFQWDQRLQAEIGVGYAIIGPQLEMSLGIAF